MKSGVRVILFCILLFMLPVLAEAQCSICTKTAEQLGEEPAKGLNAGILYLMLAPLSVAGIIGYKWWKKEKELNHGE
jgi:hypothetical protein